MSNRQNQIKDYFNKLFQDSITPWKDHGTEPLLLEFLAKVKKSFKHPKLLDIGCGDGWIGIQAAKMGIDTWGIDSSETAIQRAMQSAKDEKVAKRATFQVGDALNLPYDENFFDAILDRGLLHHILPENRVLYFQNINRVLKPGALVYLACFSQKNPVGIGQLFTKDLVEKLFSPHFKIVKFKEDPPANGPAHLLHFILKKL